MVSCAESLGVLVVAMPLQGWRLEDGGTNHPGGWIEAVAVLPDSVQLGQSLLAVPKKLDPQLSIVFFVF